MFAVAMYLQTITTVYVYFANVGIGNKILDLPQIKRSLIKDAISSERITYQNYVNFMRNRLYHFCVISPNNIKCVNEIK